MKRYIIILLAAVLFAPVLQAQDDSKKDWERLSPINNIFKISPFHFAEGTFLLSYERMLGEGNSSLMFSAGIHSRERWFDEAPQFGFQEELQFRIYVLPPNNYSAGNKKFFYFKGLYAGPYLMHRYRDRTVQNFDWILQQNVNEKERINEVAGGVLLGTQFAFGNRLFLDVFTGGGVKRSFGRSSNNQFIDVFQPGYNGVIPKVGFQLGVGF